jgi:hypothetical protein
VSLVLLHVAAAVQAFVTADGVMERDYGAGHVAGDHNSVRITVVTSPFDK